MITAYRAAMQEEMNTQRPKDPRATVDRDLAAGTLHVWVSPNESVVSTGTCELDDRGERGTVDDIYTPPELRNRGYATSLTWHLSDRVRSERPIVFLSSDADALAPTQVYKKLGFEVRCEMENLRARN